MEHQHSINEKYVCENSTKKENSQNLYESYLNRRVLVGNDIGTVKYFGKLDNSNNLWVGVEWDDEKRGKHDGCYKGIRYFYTKKPTSGSFIKIEKCEFGQSFLAAIKEKYTNEENEDDKNKENENDEVIITKVSNKEIVFVGSKLVAKKQSSLGSLSHINLNRSKVATAFGWSSSDHITHSKPLESDVTNYIDQSLNLPRLIDLDLSNNLFSDWLQIKLIVQTASNLKTLNLQHNRITKNVDFGFCGSKDIEKKDDLFKKFLYKFVFPSNIKNENMLVLCNIVLNIINHSQLMVEPSNNNKHSIDEFQALDKKVSIEGSFSNIHSKHVDDQSSSKSLWRTLDPPNFISTTLQELCVDDMALDWTSFLYLTFSFPYVTTLIASNNDIQHCSIEEYIACLGRVVPSEEIMAKEGRCMGEERVLSKVSPLICPLSLVTSLNLEGNLTLAWNEVLNLAVLLPLLQSLSLNRCNLGKIYVPRWYKRPCNLEELKMFLNDHSTGSNGKSDDKQHQECHIFLYLNHLSIVDTGARMWADYDELHLLPSLSHLQCSRGGEEQKGQWGLEVIARIANLKYLNRSQVDRDIRKNGEIAYLKKCAQQLEHEDASSVHKRHPRLTELVEKYGMPHRDEVDTGGSKLLKSSVINVHMVLCSRDAEVMSVRTRKLPLSMTVGRLKMVVRKTFAKEVSSLLHALTRSSNTSLSDGVSADNDDVRLSYSSKHNSYIASHDQSDPNVSNQKDCGRYIKPGSRLEVEIDDIFKEIGWYSIQDHDTLYVRVKH